MDPEVQLRHVRPHRWRASEPRFSLDHLRTLWGKRVVGVLGGGRSGRLIPALVTLYQQSRFRFGQLERCYEMGNIEQAFADSRYGEVVKLILHMPR